MFFKQFVSAKQQPGLSIVETLDATAHSAYKLIMADINPNNTVLLAKGIGMAIITSDICVFS